MNLFTTGLFGARPPAQFLERQLEVIRQAERLHEEEVRLEAIARGLTVETMLTELQTATYAIVDLNDLADFQEDRAWDLMEQWIIGWDEAVRAVPPHRCPAAAEFTGIPDDEFLPVSSGIFAEKPAHPPKGLRDLREP